MAKKIKLVEDITELSECPHCGSNFGYYTTCYAFGTLQENKLFEDHEPYSSGMHDSLSYSRYSKFYKCYDCHKNIARVKD